MHSAHGMFYTTFCCFCVGGGSTVLRCYSDQFVGDVMVAQGGHSIKLSLNTPVKDITVNMSQHDQTSNECDEYHWRMQSKQLLQLLV